MYDATVVKYTFDSLDPSIISSNIKRPSILPTKCISVGLALFPKRTTIIFLRSIKRVGFLQWRQVLYSAIMTEFLNIIQIHFRFTREGPVLFQPHPYEICGGKRVFTENLRLSLSVSFQQYSILVFIYMLILPGQTDEAWETSKGNAL